MAQKTRVPKNHPVKVRLVRYLTAMGVYNESSNETVDLYVENYDFYQQMREELRNNKLLMEYTNKGGATNIVKNPLAIEITKIVQVLSNLLKSMGLTPAQAATMKDFRKLKTWEELDEFEGF